MEKPKFVPRDEVDAEIQKELEAEGVKIDGEPEKPAEEGQPAPKPPAKLPVKKEEEKKDDEEEEESDDEEEDEDEGVESTPAKPEKKPKFVESWKVGAMKREHAKAISDLNDKIKELSKKPDDTKKEAEDKDAALKATAEELGMDESALRKIVALTGGGNTKELQDKIAALETQINSTKEKVDWEEENRQFGKDFDKKIMPILAEQGITEEKTISRIKKRLEKMAFSESFQGVPTIDGIYRGYPSYFADITKPGKAGVEAGSRGGAKSNKKNFMDMTPDEVGIALEKGEITDEDFDKYCDKNSKQRFKPMPVQSLKGRG
jgi:hypothetical protein